MPEDPKLSEPENVVAPNVGVDGKQSSAEEVKLKKSEYDDIQKSLARTEQLEKFVQTLSPFMIETADGGLDWNIAKIVEDSDYDPSSLVKKGEKKPVPEPTKIEKKELVEEFSKDPEAFMAKIAQKAVEAVKGTIDPELRNIKSDLHARRTSEMLAEVRMAHPDFDSLSPEISALIKRRPPQNAEELEQLYFAAKGYKEAGATPGLGLTTSSSRARKEAAAPPLTPEDRIRQEILEASGKNTNKPAMRNVFGKSFLSPL